MTVEYRRERLHIHFFVSLQINRYSFDSHLHFPYSILVKDRSFWIATMETETKVSDSLTDFKVAISSSYVAVSSFVALQASELKGLKPSLLA